MYKLLKNKFQNNLHSDAEQRGRGMRHKAQYNKNLFQESINSDSDNDDDEPNLMVSECIQNDLQFPPFPKRKKGNC